MKRTILSLAFAAGLISPSLHAAENWPQFRGPNCSGVSESAKPPIVFAPGTNQLWKISVPPGASSPCVWGDRIFLTAFDGGKLETHCYARRDGKLLWKHAAPADKLEEFHSTEGSPAASTCATDGKVVVSYFGSCGLVAHDLDGRELWQHKLPVAQSGGSFGTGGSPVIVGGLVVVPRENIGACSLLAVDLKSGKKAWETPRADVSPGFGTPIVWRNGQTDQVVMPGSLKLKGYDVKSGMEAWSLAGMPSFACTTPVAGEGMLYFAGWSPGKGDSPAPTWAGLSAQFDKNKDNAVTPDEVKGSQMETFFKSLDMNRDGKWTKEDFDIFSAQIAKGENVLVAVKPGAEGEVSEKSVAWKQTRGLPYVPSPLLYRGAVILLKDGGMVSSYDAKTGAVNYQQERLKAQGSYYASPVAADGRIYVASLDGKITVFKAGGGAPEILHEAKFGERIAATPALVGNQIIVRTPTALYAFGK
ncbi:MAG: PQQ-binding-like beta-propeller repeat protein [Verrucomicrobia bacterium]|nr:PQQ-binding-like beta-propeller repeat protein [Verrucomicrobiota bacterium]